MKLSIQILLLTAFLVVGVASESSIQQQQRRRELISITSLLNPLTSLPNPFNWLMGLIGIGDSSNSLQKCQTELQAVCEGEVNAAVEEPYVEYVMNGQDRKRRLDYTLDGAGPLVTSLMEGGGDYLTTTGNLVIDNIRSVFQPFNPVITFIANIFGLGPPPPTTDTETRTDNNHKPNFGNGGGINLGGGFDFGGVGGGIDFGGIGGGGGMGLVGALVFVPLGALVLKLLEDTLFPENHPCTGDINQQQTILEIAEEELSNAAIQVNDVLSNIGTINPFNYNTKMAELECELEIIFCERAASVQALITI